MKLQELSSPKQTHQLARVFESYFGSSIKFDRVPARQVKVMLSRVQGLLSEHRQQTAFHISENNPSYLKLVMLEKALRAHIHEMSPPAGGVVAVDMNDPKTKATLDKAGKGQMLNPDEQKTVNAIAMMKKEAAKKNKRPVTESEVQQAQVVLAAQDMVDEVQGMLEDATEMQFKELPALVDSVRNQVGADQAMQFSADANAALQSLVQSLQGTKQQLETALGVVTGQAPAVPGDTAGLGTDDLTGMAAGDVEGAVMPDGEEEVATDELEVDDIQPSTKTLGRARR